MCASQAGDTYWILVRWSRLDEQHAVLFIQMKMEISVRYRIQNRWKGNTLCVSRLGMINDSMRNLRWSCHHGYQAGLCFGKCCVCSFKMKKKNCVVSHSMCFRFTYFVSYMNLHNLPSDFSLWRIVTHQAQIRDCLRSQNTNMNRGLIKKMAQQCVVYLSAALLWKNSIRISSAVLPRTHAHAVYIIDLNFITSLVTGKNSLLLLAVLTWLIMSKCWRVTFSFRYVFFTVMI